MSVMEHNSMDIKIYPKARHLDGVYCRVMRNGNACSLAFTDLTHEEQEEFLQTLTPDGIKKMCFILAETLRDIADQFNVVAKQE